jgi:hypothetical protein
VVAELLTLTINSTTTTTAAVVATKTTMSGHGTHGRVGSLSSGTVNSNLNSGTRNSDHAFLNYVIIIIIT